MKTKFAELSWCVEDVQTLRPSMSDEDARVFLIENENHIRDRLCELGWDVMEVLLPAKTEADADADA